MSDDMTLEQHEARSQGRYEALCDKLDNAAQAAKESKMGMDNVSDKVNINVGDGGGGGGGFGGAAALIAALGNRNEGGDTAGLIAALGNRNNDGMGMAAMLPALLANNNNGMNNLWPIILLALLGRGRGGFGFGGDDGGCNPGGVGPGHAAILQTLLEGQSSLRAEVPTTALETQNAVQAAIAQLALAGQQSAANTKDAIQNGISFLDRDIQMVGANVSAQGCATREAVQNDGDKTRALLVQRFSQEDATRIAGLQAEVIELRNEGRRRADHDELRIQVSNTNIQTQAQAQAQEQRQRQSDFDLLHRRLDALLSVQSNRNRSDQDIINLGTMLASGVQTPTTTQVNR